MGPLQQLHALGQSIWYDNIQRRLLENGVLAALIDQGEIRGITSNPSIFNQAVAKTNDYDPALLTLAQAGWNAEQIFTQLAVEDIQAAADLFASLYQQSNAADGYVSLEVSPYLAQSTEGTVEEAKRLWERVARPNLMIKIPATKAGIPAISQTIASGINVNVTLIFSLERYGEVMDAFLSGLEERASQGLPIEGIASVASFFVSRVDTKIDGQLQAIIQEESNRSAQAARLVGRAAIANAKLAYEQFLEVFNGERFRKLAAQGGQAQRPLWASTSTKNPAYSDVLYVDELIGPQTVDTLPPLTLDAYRDHGRPRLTLVEKVAEAHQTLAELEELGISMARVTQELEDEGVKTFSDAYAALLKTVEDRRAKAIA